MRAHLAVVQIVLDSACTVLSHWGPRRSLPFTMKVTSASAQWAEDTLKVSRHTLTRDDLGPRSLREHLGLDSRGSITTEGQLTWRSNHPRFSLPPRGE